MRTQRPDRLDDGLKKVNFTGTKLVHQPCHRSHGKLSQYFLDVFSEYVAKIGFHYDCGIKFLISEK
jgi:hypothetical protein